MILKCIFDLNLNFFFLTIIIIVLNLYFTEFKKSVNRQLIVQKHEIKNVQDRLDILISMQEKMYER